MALSELPAIHRLDLATVVLPEWHPEAARTPVSPVYGYAIDHPDGVILFDTGVGHHPVIDELYSPTITSVADALESCGLLPERIVAVVNSHLHFDHCGQNPMLFGTDTPLFCGGEEIDAVEHVPRYTVPEWAVAPESQQRLVTADEQLTEGVTILAAPGHTSGHVALLVEGGGRRVVIGGQAVWGLDEFVDEVATDSNVTVDGLHDAALDTIRRLKALRPERIHFAHCDHWDAPPDVSGS